jgi:hypothetical protein
MERGDGACKSVVRLLSALGVRDCILAGIAVSGGDSELAATLDAEGVILDQLGPDRFEHC